MTKNISACAVLCCLLSGCNSIGSHSLTWFSTSFIFPAVMTVVIGGMFFDRKILTVNVLLITMVNVGCFFLLPNVAKESLRVISLGVFSGYFAMIGLALSDNMKTGQSRFRFVCRTVTRLIMPCLCVLTLWWALSVG